MIRLVNEDRIEGFLWPKLRGPDDRLAATARATASMSAAEG
jgi:hypothetical protein